MRLPLLIASLLGTLFAPSAQALWIDIAPARTSIGVGDVFTVAVRAGDLPEQEVISFFNLLLGYDETVLEAQAVTFSSVLGDESTSFRDFALTFNPNTEAPPDYTNFRGLYNTAVRFGNLSLAEDPLADLGPLQQPQPFDLASVRFKLLAALPAQGTVLQLIDDSFFDFPIDSGGEFDLKGADGSNVLSASLSDGTVTMPVPGSLALLVSLVPLLIARRRR